MRLSVLPSTSITLPVVHAQMVHVWTPLRRSWHGSTRRVPQKHRQYIGLQDWLDWARPPSPIRSASSLMNFACHSPPSFAHSSLTAGTRSFLSPLCAATFRNFITHMQLMFCRF